MVEYDWPTFLGHADDPPLFLSDEAEAWRFVEMVRWPNGPVCPHCGVVGHAYYLQPKTPRTTKKGTVSARRLWKCGACRKQFSVLVGTIFEDSKIPLEAWLFLVLGHVEQWFHSAPGWPTMRDLSRRAAMDATGLTYKTIWLATQRIQGVDQATLLDSTDSKARMITFIRAASKPKGAPS